ncbi:hypothetical protein GGX14DRAFT_401367 [Mycena pura]|uniref:Uncharacterized protein n=1 Tax=Mycena pura TaxID=153505 RepID=A0AAD6Y3H7_9AGAR|nr:hypothetical protein GGX14DRAFT_401367 [Mycena pura]
MGDSLRETGPFVTYSSNSKGSRGRWISECVYRGLSTQFRRSADELLRHTSKSFEAVDEDQHLEMREQPRTFSRTRKFCQEIDEVKLTENQMCTIRMPRYLDPAYQYHTNPTLTAIFNAAVPQVAEILAKFDTSHPVVEDFNAYFRSPGAEGRKMRFNPARDAHAWIVSCGLRFNPELEAILQPVLATLMTHPSLAHLAREEANQRIFGVGSALLQLLAVQHELQEVLNLNGDLLGDLKDERVISCPYDGDEALEMMFSFVSGESVDVSKALLRFKTKYAVWDNDYRPLTFRRDDESRIEPTEPIIVTVKRTGAQVIDTEPPRRRAKVVEGEKARKPRERLPKTSGQSQAPSPRRLRSKK